MPSLTERNFHNLLDNYTDPLTCTVCFVPHKLHLQPRFHYHWAISNSYDFKTNKFYRNAKHIGKRALRRHWYRASDNSLPTSFNAPTQGDMSSKCRKGISTCCAHPTCGTHPSTSSMSPSQTVSPNHRVLRNKPRDIPIKVRKQETPAKKTNNSSKQRKPRYKPTAIPTSHDLPHLNLTVKQTNTQSKISQRISMLAPSCFKTAFNSFNKYKLFSIIMETGASICVTPEKDDFLDYQTKTDIKQVKGLGGKVSLIAGQGNVVWSVHDSTGTLWHLKLKAYHIPSAKSWAISTNELLTKYKGEHLIVDSRSM